MNVTVRKVENKADHKTFFEFPWTLYRDYPYWVSELPSMRRETLDKKHHAAWEYMTGEYFLAWRGDTPVGTIAAFVNHRHNEYQEENIGFFGFFECVDDQTVADALFETAESYLKEHAVDAIRGPASFTSNEYYGLLVEGFDQPPMILMPYNPEYYIRLIENAGFTCAMNLLSWKQSLSAANDILYEADGTTEKRLIRAVRRNMQRREITVRSLDTRQKRAQLTQLKELYNVAWEKNWGFVPMSERELEELIKSLGMLLIPDYAYFAYVKDELVGFFLLVPNLNEVLVHVKAHPGLPEVWWYLKALWHWKIRSKITSLRAVLMGVKEEYRGLGVDAALHLTFAEASLKDSRFQWAEASWILETNDETNRLLEHFDCTVHRRHRIYEKTL